MRRLIATTAAAALVLSIPTAKAQPRPEFKPFESLRNNQPCNVTFTPTTIDICGASLLTSDVRGWGLRIYSDQSYRFTIYDQTLKHYQIAFINKMTADYFQEQFFVWSGKPPYTGRAVLKDAYF